MVHKLFCPTIQLIFVFVKSASVSVFAARNSSDPFLSLHRQRAIRHQRGRGERRTTALPEQALSQQDQSSICSPGMFHCHRFHLNPSPSFIRRTAQL